MRCCWIANWWRSTAVAARISAYCSSGCTYANPTRSWWRRCPVSLYVFDVLELDGQRLLTDSYDVRRERLLDLGLDGVAGVQVPPSFTENMRSAGCWTWLAALQFEGVVAAKRRASRYDPGRRGARWVKNRDAEHAGGAGGRRRTEGQGRRLGTVGALVLGARDLEGRLRYLGNVGTGFTNAMLGDLRARPRALERGDSPFDEQVPREYIRGVRWVTPLLVGEVQYRTLTSDGRLRHAAWRGLRPDREPDEVHLNPP